MINVARIDKALQLLALNGRYRINAYQVAYLSRNNDDVNAVYQYLLSREPYVVQRSFEVQCPNQHSTAVYSRIEEIPNKWMECRVCAEEFIPEPNNVHIVFDFTPDYLNEISEIELTEKKNLRPAVLI